MMLINWAVVTLRVNRHKVNKQRSQLTEQLSLLDLTDTRSMTKPPNWLRSNYFGIWNIQSPYPKIPIDCAAVTLRFDIYKVPCIRGTYWQPLSISQLLFSIYLYFLQLHLMPVWQLVVADSVAHRDIVKEGST